MDVARSQNKKPRTTLSVYLLMYTRMRLAGCGGPVSDPSGLRNHRTGQYGVRSKTYCVLTIPRLADVVVRLRKIMHVV
eukprot:948825-Alexandrium_andersonii.AAC.1